MRQNPIRREATFIRFVCTALFILGIALVDLSVVWAHTPTSLPSWHDSGTLFPQAAVCGVANGTTAPLDAAAGRACPSTRQTLSTCFTSDCRPGASLLATSRPHAAMSRFAGRVGMEALEAADVHLHPVTLLELVEPKSPTEQVPLSVSAGHSPARIAGADLSIPRPPPV
jgi:hypothetical protein